MGDQIHDIIFLSKILKLIKFQVKMIAPEIQEAHWYLESFLVNHGTKLVFEVNSKVKLVKPMDLESTQMLVNT